MITADWYFTRCLSTENEPERAAVLLGILECVDRAAGDSLTQRLAVEELMRLDSWMQTYALPRVLKLAERATSSVAAACDRYFEALVSQVPEHEPLLDLLRAAISGDSRDLMRTFSAAMQRPSTASHHPTDIPYVDARDFLPENVVLAALACAAERSGRIAEDLREDDALLRPLVNRAVNEEHGRLAFVLGVRLSFLCGYDSIEELGRRVKTHAGFLMQPDLVELWIWLHFVAPPDSSIQALLSESIELTIFHRFPATKPVDNQGKSHYLHPLPANLADTRWRPAEVILWQFALWNAAVAIDPKTTAAFLAPLWLFPRRHPRPITISHPGPQRRAEEWKNTLQSVADLRREEVKLAVVRAEAASPGDAASIIASPFVEIDPNRITTFDKKHLRYPTTTDWVTILRLLLGTSLAARLLPLVENAGLRPFAALLVQAHDALAAFELRNPTGRGLRQPIAPALRVLALFTQQQATEATSCSDPAVSPNTFLDLFESGPESARDETIFCTHILPSVLMSFIADVFGSAIRGNGEARWLDAIPMIAPAVGAQDDYHRRETEQVIRFLSSDLDTPLFDWRFKRVQDWNYLNYRDLLTDRDPRPIDWHQPRWRDPDEATNKSYRQLRVTLAVQRFVASFREAGGVPNDVLTRWRSQLVDELTVLNHERDFDRFLRLRLIEIVSDSTLDTTVDERRTIAGIILEFGNSFQVERLLDNIFTNSAPSDVSLCSDLLPLIAKEAYATGRNDSAVVRDPRDHRRRLERRRVMRDALGRIAALATTEPSYAEIARRLMKLRVEADRAMTSHLQRVTLDYDGEDAAEWPQPAGQPSIAREIVSISRDPNRATITILFADYETGSAVCLFDATMHDREKLLGSGRLEVLGLVVSVKPQDESFATVVNWGGGACLEFITPQRPAVDTGDRVAVVVVRNGASWAIAEAPRPLARRRAARYAEAKLEIDVSRGRNNIVVYIQDRLIADETAQQRGPDGGFFDRRYWVPLIRDSFNRKRRVFGTIAEHVETGEWRPIVRELWQLAVAVRARAEVALTLVDVRADEEMFIVCDQPGSLYKLRYADLSGGDRERLAKMIDETTDPRGTQIVGSLSIDGDDQRLRLRLAEEAFDFRDVTWRSQFQGAESCLAERLGPSYSHSIDTPVRGYPERITVILSPPYPSQGREIEFSPSGHWDPWRSTVTGTVLLFNALSVAEHQRPAFIDEWARLSIGKPLTIRRAIAQVSPFGDVLCTTSDGTTVNVVAESLTMGSVERIGRRDLNRHAEVIRVVDLEPLEMEVDAGKLPEAVRDSQITGVIARAPRLKDAKTSPRVSLGVWWYCGSTVVESELAVSAQSARRVYLGSLVEVRPTAERATWKVRITPRTVKARALWRVEPVAAIPPKDSLYLGLVMSNQKQQAFVEREPGVLVPLVFAPNAKHVAAFDGSRYAGGFSPGDRVRVDSPSGGRNPRLQVLLPSQSADRNIVWGDASRQYRGEASVGVQLRMLQRPDSWFAVERHFTPTAKHAPVIARRDVHSEDINAKDREELERYFERTDKVLQVSVLNPHLVRLRGMRVPEDSSRDRWTSDVPVHQDHRPYLAGVDYNRDNARVCLFRDEAGRVFASFRLVPPITVAAYIEAEFGETDTEKQPLRTRLYYAGPEGTQHRFEWEYGSSLLADEADLRIDGRPFASVEAVLFIGDALTSASVIREQERRILSFDSLTIRYSESTHLYLQRKKRIVHVLKLTLDNENGLRITSVIGFAEHSTADSHPFTRSRATLTERARAIVLERFAERAEAAMEGMTIFGRFDDEAYRQSLGRISSFDHVVATIDPEVGLKGDELVFLTATRVRTDIRNDCGVELSPAGLHPRDVRPDLREVRILRRNFSVREEVLSRIADTDPAVIHGRLYLVRLNLPREGQRPSQFGSRGVSGSLWRNMPVRSATALKTLLTSGFVLATVINDPKRSKNIDVEYSPGIFLRVPHAEFQFDDPELARELTRGSVVRLEAIDDRVRVTRGAFAEIRYVLQTELRPVVVLPKNELADDRRDAWQRGDASWSALKFPIGGLPNVLATPGRYDAPTGRWFPPSVAEFRALMQRPHPKLAVAGVDQAGDVRIAPSVQGEPVGSIVWDDVTRDPRFVPHPSTGGKERPLEWSRLSFADVPAQDIARRIRIAKWRYHDTTTTTWVGRDGARDQDLRWHDGTNGPLFFDDSTDDLTLRFPPAAIERLGFSARELIASLEKGITEYVVARATANSLWVEIAPGRVAEVPHSQMVTASGRGFLSLENLQWDVFSPGDHVTLRLGSSDPKVADKIVLNDWRPGVRGSFPASAVLPVIGYDGDSGAIELGGGEFRLTFPRFALDLPTVVRVTPQNHLASAQSAPIRPGDDALLIVDEGKLRLAGVEGLAVPASMRDYWEGDPFAEHFAGNWRGMKRLVDAAGGSLPVTIEAFRGNNVIFSRRHQKAASAIPPGRFGFCRVLGLMDADSMLLRHGSGIIPASAASVVSGLPRSLYAAAATLLHYRQIPIWIRRRADGGECEFGLGEEGHSVEAEVIDVLSSQQHDRMITGLVCRSNATGALYWLPIEFSAWTRLTPAEAGAIFVANPERKTITAAVRRDHFNNRILTLTGTTEALAELRALDVDQEIAVRVVAPRASTGSAVAPSHYLVETLSSNRMLLDCRVEQPLVNTSTTMRVEIIRRLVGRLTLVLSTPVDARRYSVDLPAWMTMTTDEAKGAAPQSADQLHATSPERPSLVPAPGGHLSDERLSQLWTTLNRKTTLDVERAGMFVEQWAVESLRRDEVDLKLALICFLSMWELIPARRKLVPKDLDLAVVREFVQEWSQGASEFLRNIGRRALRSLHVEVLSTMWIRQDEPAPPRLAQLRDLLQPSMKAADVALVRQFSRYAELGGAMVLGWDLQMISDALRRAIGEAEVRDSFHEGARILHRIASLAATMPAVPYLRVAPDRAHVEVVRELLDIISSRRLDITLLAPIPIMDRIDSDAF